MHILLCKLAFVGMETLDEQALDHIALSYQKDSLYRDGNLKSILLDL